MLHSIKTYYEPKLDNNAIAAELNRSIPSATIRLTLDDIKRLEQLVTLPANSKTGWYYVPSDIIEGNIVPIRSLQIQLDRRPSIEGITLYNVFAIDRDMYGDSAGIAICIPNVQDMIFDCHIISVEDGHLCFPYYEELGKEQADEFCNILYTICSFWYYVQIALLHPTIKEVFRHSGIMSDKDREESKDYKKRPLFYQKVKTINMREFDEAVKHSINRKALIWYVIGHWRTYKDGRRIFIQPYWKGALRETKTVETPRERII